MVKDRTVFQKYRSERSGELSLACTASRHSVSAVLYDSALSRRYARAVRFGVTLTQENALDVICDTALRALRESGTPGNVIRKAGFAAPADITLALEDGLEPGCLFLSPEVELVILPMISAALGGDMAAVVASALQAEGSFTVADVTGGFRAASFDGKKLYTAHAPLKGGLDGTALESGMPLELGAVDELNREPDGTLCYSVAGDGDSAGISAAAAVNAVRIMLDCGALDSYGIMTDRDLFYIGEDLYVTQQDVRAVQSDKAAFRAALELFGRHAGATSRFIASGEAFGSEQGARAMAELGAVPAGIAGKYGWCRRPGEQGVIVCLSDPGILEKLTGLCGSAEDISAAIHEDFDDLYIKNLAF